MPWLQPGAQKTHGLTEVRLFIILAQQAGIMDFDKILRQWEESQKQAARKKNSLPDPKPGSGKKANAPGKPGKGAPDEGATLSMGTSPVAPVRKQVNAADYLNHWMTLHGVQDKDDRPDSGDDDKSARIEEAERLRRMHPQATLDLHGKTAAEAETLIVDFLVSSSRLGLDKVLIIHGKGLHSTNEPIMADVVRRALETNSLAGSFGPADRNSGGRGATWVRIRKRDYFSR
jgi:DNA-nicking Smr family endonuclease